MDLRKKKKIFAKGKSMVLVKNLKFLHFFFLGKVSREKVFGEVLVTVTKLACLDYKNINIR